MRSHLLLISRRSLPSLPVKQAGSSQTGGTRRLIFLMFRMLIRRTVALLALLLLLLPGCSALPAPAPTPTPLPPSPTPIPRGGNLTIRLDQDVGPLQPWQPRSRGEEQIIALLYRGLTRLDEQLRPQPDLATGWVIDQPGKTVTFTLRLDATWHDGQPLNAADALWTIQTLQAVSPTTTLLADFRRIIADVQAPTSSTLVLRLTEPYAPLLSELSLPILPRHLFEKRTAEEIAGLDFWSEPVGSGPFKFEERKPGQAIVLTRYENFYGGAPYLERVAFIVAPDAQVTAEALESGDLLLAELPWQITRALSETSDAAPLLRFGSYVENGYYYLAFNLRQDRLFSDPRLREALAYAIDLPALVEEVTDGQGVPLGSDLLPNVWPGAGPPPAPYDPAYARGLLEEAGWRLPADGAIRERDGITLTAELLVRADDERRLQAARQIARAARAIGMDLVVTPADFDTTIQSKLAPPFDFDLMLMSWINSRVDSGRPSYVAYDPDHFALFHSSQIYQGAADTRRGLRNYVAFSDQSFDNQVTAARSLFDTRQRSQIYTQTAAILAENRPYLFLWADRQPVAMNARVQSADGPPNLNTPAYLNGIERWYIVGEY